MCTPITCEKYKTALIVIFIYMRNFTKVIIVVLVISAIFVFARPIVKVTKDWASDDLKQIEDIV